MRKLLRITAVAGYRGKRYRDETSLPREALEFPTQKMPKDTWGSILRWLMPDTGRIGWTRLPHFCDFFSVCVSYYQVCALCYLFLSFCLVFVFVFMRSLELL